jgi:hypothetical protein
MKRSRIGVIVIMVALPIIVMPVLNVLLGVEMMRSVLIYTAPLMLLPLLLRLAKKAKKRRSS